MNSKITEMSSEISGLSKNISQSMDMMKDELHETNKTIRESLKITSDTIQSMSENFTKTLEEMKNMKINMDVRETLLSNLGLEGILPTFLKGKQKKK
jgi:methyl-accepting chemotaxis protein